MDVCIQEGNNNNIVNINQIQPIQSELKRGSTSCHSDQNSSSKPNSNSGSKPSEQDPNNNPVDHQTISERPSSSTTSELTTSEPVKSTQPTTLSNEPETGSNDNDGSQS